MKILLLTDSMDVGGAETHVASLCRYLARRGHKVFLLSGGGRLCDPLRKEGVVCVDVALRDRTPGGIVRSSLMILRAAVRIRPHLIHAHGRFAAFVAEKISSLLDIPLAVTSHADPSKKRLPSFFSSVGDLCIAVSCDIKMKLCRLYDVYSDNVKVIPNGIDTEYFSYSYKNREGIKKIVFVSRLDRDCSMGAYGLVRLSPLLKKKLGVGEIVICGGGEEYSSLVRLEQRIRERYGETGVRFTGALEDVRTELCDATLFVGVSRAAMEAMAMGIPTLLAGNEGMSGLCDGETLEYSEKTNFCCRGEAPISSGRLYEELRRFSLMSGKERERLSLLSRRYIKERRSAEDMGRRTERLYLELVCERGRRKRQRGKSCLICGYFGYGNMGDDALLRGAIKRAEREGYGDIKALTRYGDNDRRKYGVRCIGRFSPIGVIDGIRGADRVVFGGGTLFQNSTSCRSLIYYLSLLGIARLFGKPWEMWGGGIGELFGEWAERGVARALKRCGHIGVREDTSRQRAAELIGKDEGIYLESDLSENIASLDGSYGEYFMRHYGIGGKFIIAAPKGGERAELYGEMIKWLREARKNGYSVAVCALYPRQDGRICKRIAELCDGRYIEKISPEEYGYLASRAGYVVGMRLHSLLFAARYGKECIAIGDGVKIKAFEKNRQRSYGKKVFS